MKECPNLVENPSVSVRKWEIENAVWSLILKHGAGDLRKSASLLFGQEVKLTRLCQFSTAVEDRLTLLHPTFICYIDYAT